MLFKFTSPDLENTSIIDCSTGDVIYHVSTPGACLRARSRSSTSIRSFATHSSSSREKIDMTEPKVTSLIDNDGLVAAEIFWENKTATVIRIGDETLAGTRDLFDASCVRVLEDETLLPTRMEYTWRSTEEELQLLDDDSEIIGRYHPDCASDDLLPAYTPGSGNDYFELDLDAISEDEVVELFVSYLLMHSLRERMYSLCKMIHNHQVERATVPKSPLHRLRYRAGRSIANLRETFRRNSS
ncbi:hypothetical protein BXZ70DRAFT_1003792 [Cristinia sonorae]|uniref:DUF6593 domain-containing protein n=1 Tax=Cristinia sonorae TaxID=1940300 RepID=A0A8K0UX60_9AGAR|nr:hypothetical protein BXZ70DRAFT_1003792 [Cristinia sonorae]